MPTSLLSHLFSYFPSVEKKKQTDELTDTVRQKESDSEQKMITERKTEPGAWEEGQEEGYKREGERCHQGKSRVKEKQEVQATQRPSSYVWVMRAGY